MEEMKGILAILMMVGLLAPSAFATPPAHQSATWTAKMKVPTHRPKAREKWPVKIVVKTASGRRLRGTVQYHFLFAGQVVATQGCHKGRPDPCRFKRGVYRDVVRWPRRSAGYKLTFRATVKTKLGTKNLNWWVKVRR